MDNEEKKTLAREAMVALALMFALGLTFANAAPVVLAQSAPTVSDARARTIALRAVPGIVVEIEREEGELEVMVRATDGRLMEVEIDAHTGRVLEIEAEEDGPEEEEEDDD